MSLIRSSLAYSEIMLNLAKALEVLAKSDSRESLRAFSRSLGLTSSEIETQVIPIALIRNEVDIAHPVATPATAEQVATYRKYVDRSIENVAAIFQRVFEKITQNDAFLPPIPVVRSAARERFANQLSSYLLISDMPQ